MEIFVVLTGLCESETAVERITSIQKQNIVTLFSVRAHHVHESFCSGAAVYVNQYRWCYDSYSFDCAIVNFSFMCLVFYTTFPIAPRAVR